MNSFTVHSFSNTSEICVVPRTSVLFENAELDEGGLFPGGAYVIP